MTTYTIYHVRNRHVVIHEPKPTLSLPTEDDDKARDFVQTVLFKDADAWLVTLKKWDLEYIPLDDPIIWPRRIK